MIYFIADTHFNDANIICYENRPFQDVEEMNNTLITNWNMLISPDDIVYHLGDVGNYCKDIILQLKGKKFLVKGNHDTSSNSTLRNIGFEGVYNHPIILDDFFICSHQPMYVHMNMPYANIFGHIHNNPMYRTVSPRSYCVSVERTVYAPISFDDIKARIKEANTKNSLRKSE